MPRVKSISGVDAYKGYAIKEKYEYDVRQLDKIIEILEYYRELSLIDDMSDYVVFDITIKVHDTPVSPYFNPCDNDDGFTDSFNVNDLKEILSEEHFFYRWTREWSQKNREHYHLIVIANHIPKSEYMASLHQLISSVQGVKSVFISPRLLADDDHRRIIHFHWLNRDIDSVDGLNDAINRHSYKAKLDQKLDGIRRTFDGSRILKPLMPISKRLESLHCKPS
ncbi:MAG: hypothetical protein RR490_10570 [Niameybacter sp.]